MPMFSNDSVYYHGHSAISHTKKKVTEMRKRGIDILSYFVSGSYERESTFNDFKAMYGSSAKVIGMNDVRQIAKTMNNLFLAK